MEKFQPIASFLPSFFEGQAFLYQGLVFDAPYFLSVEEMITVSAQLEKEAKSSYSNLEAKARRKALWQSRALLLMACLTEKGEEIVTAGLGFLEKLTTLAELQKIVYYSTPLPPLFPEDRKTARAKINGEIMIYPPSTDFDINRILVNGTVAPFVVFPDGTLACCFQPTRHLTVAGGEDVFAVGNLIPDTITGRVKAKLTSYDYVIPQERELIINRMLSLLSNP